MAVKNASLLHVDRLLTNYSERFMNEQDVYIWDQMFPSLRSESESDLYRIYDRGDWFRSNMQRRAPGATYPKSEFSISQGTYVTKQWAEAYDITDEDRQKADAPMVLEQDAAEFLTNSMSIFKETKLQEAAFVAGAWASDVSPAALWDDSTNGIPITDMDTALRTIRLASGMKANTIAMGEIVWAALLLNEQITSKVSDSKDTLKLNESTIATALRVDTILVSEAVQNTAAEGATDNFRPIIDNDAVVLVNRPPGVKRPTAGIHYFWEPGGGMGMMSRVRDDDRDTDVARIKTQFVNKVQSNFLGYRFAAVTAATP